MPETESLPDLAGQVRPLIQMLQVAVQPRLMATLERAAADRYRAWSGAQSASVEDNIRPIVSHGWPRQTSPRTDPAWHSADKAPGIVRGSCQSPWAWSNCRGRMAGALETLAQEQTTTLAGGPATSLVKPRSRSRTNHLARTANAGS